MTTNNKTSRLHHHHWRNKHKH